MDTRIPLSKNELIKKLEVQLNLLKKYHKKAFEETREEYLGEVAGKLRLLVLKMKNNRPLLLDLMEKYSVLY